MNKKLQHVLLFVTILGFISTARAEEVENNLESRTSLELGISATEKLSFTFAPEMRFDNNFSLDQFVLKTSGAYDITDFLQIGAQYRLGIIPQEAFVPAEKYHRYAFNIKTKYKIARFTSSLRLRYSNDADDEVNDKQYLRYKAGVKYNIKGLPLTPSVGLEAFQQLGDESGLHKMRYMAGLKYKINKKNAIALKYRMDYFVNDFKNNHILSLGYSIKL